MWLQNSQRGDLEIDIIAGPVLFAETERAEGIIVVRVVNRHGGAGSGRWGVLRSEVKEEASAGRSMPGDMSGAERPAGLISLDLGMWGLRQRK